jgi:hypothetical protein
MRARSRSAGRPSPAMLVALGGTAYAATTIVNIADPTTPANKAKVGRDRLPQDGVDRVGRGRPKTPFFAHDFAFVGPGGTNVLITANQATVALSRVVLENYYGNAAGQTAQILLAQVGGNAISCDLSSAPHIIGMYDVAPGQSSADPMEIPVVLKPLATGDVWCLMAVTTKPTARSGEPPRAS